MRTAGKSFYQYAELASGSNICSGIDGYGAAGYFDVKFERDV
ncbi:hypothetical protein OKW13_000413 [Bacillus velezensis]|nr:hypothetical protein [Bacillus velezensis]MDF9779750.1 hypothetical protein [Bacillus velezensis]